jgi:hypothetical protein
MEDPFDAPLQDLHAYVSPLAFNNFDRLHAD